MTFGSPLRSNLNRLRRPIFRCAILLALMSELGCQDYNPSWQYADTPSTLPVEQEDILIDNGEIVLEQLDLDGLSDIGEATKSLKQLNQERQKVQQASEFAPDAIATEPWVTLDKLPIERWESYYQGNKVVGYIRREFQKSPVNESDRLLIKSVSEMRTGASNDAPANKSQLLIVESRRGEFRSLDGTLTSGDSTNTVKAVVVLDTLTVTSVRDGKRTERKIPLDPNLRGPFAAEESLMQSPMKQGEVRNLLTFDPSVADVVQVELIGRGMARVPMASGDFFNLFEIEQRAHFGKDVFITTLWTDESGEIKKRYLGARGMTSNQVSQEKGLAMLDAVKLKNVEKKAVTLAAPIDTKLDVTKLSFRATSRRSDPFNYFSPTSWQLIHSVSPMSVNVDVTRSNVQEELKQRFDQSMPVEEMYLAPSYYIDFQKPLIADLKEQWLQSEEDLPPALKIAKGVQKHLRIREFEFNVHSADEIVGAKTCDSLGAAILMCAVARSAAIPARVAYGLTYYENADGQEMQFHAWTEIYHGGKWLPIDCTQPDLQIPLATLKVTDSALETQNAFTTILKVFDAIQALELTLRPN